MGENEKNLLEDSDLKTVMELSLNEYLDDLSKELPKEPSLDEPFFDVNVKPADKSIFFSRRFNPTDKISAIKTFSKIKLRTYADIKLCGAYNNKIYVKDNETLEEANIKDKDTFIIQEKK